MAGKIKDEVVKVLERYDNGEYYNHIKDHVLPGYGDDKAHNTSHIFDVVNRAFDLNENLQLDLDFKVISAAAFYHDIGRKVDNETHEIISAQVFMDDEVIQSFFDAEYIPIIKEAIEDHRASLEGDPRNIYGKLLSSADRNIDIKEPFIRTYHYRQVLDPSASLEKNIRDSFEHLRLKFGNDGYANKVWFDDGAYQKYLDDLRLYLDDYDLFRSEYLKINITE